MQSQEILKEFASLEAESSFISKNFLRLQKEFSNKFIAVKDSSLVTSADSFPELLKQLMDKRLNVNQVVIQFIPQAGQIILY